MRKIFLTTAAVMLTMSISHADVLQCGRAVVTPPEYDPNPVMSTEVTYNQDTHVWLINHFRLDGSVVARQQQYGITDWPYDDDIYNGRWAGDLLRDPHRNIHMVGWLRYTNQGIFYEEQVYNRSHGNRLETRIVSQCQIIRPTRQYADPPWTRRLEPYTPPPQPTPAPNGGSAIVQGPVQQNGPIVTPTPNITIYNYPDHIREIPGTSWSPIPKDESRPGS